MTSQGQAGPGGPARSGAGGLKPLIPRSGGGRTTPEYSYVSPVGRSLSTSAVPVEIIRLRLPRAGPQRPPAAARLMTSSGPGACWRVLLRLMSGATRDHCCGGHTLNFGRQ